MNFLKQHSWPVAIPLFEHKTIWFRIYTTLPYTVCVNPKSRTVSWSHVCVLSGPLWFMCDSCASRHLNSRNRRSCYLSSSLSVCDFKALLTSEHMLWCSRPSRVAECMWLWKRWCPQGWSPRAWAWDCSRGGRRAVASRSLPYPALPGKCCGLQGLSCPFFSQTFFLFPWAKLMSRAPIAQL